MKIGFALLGCVVLAAQVPLLHAQERPAPLSLLDVPFITQSEALCGGAAAAMVLRYWGERGIEASSFEHLVDRSAAGIRTGALVDELRRRSWNVVGLQGRDDVVRAQLSAGRPVVALIEDRPDAYHYVVIVGSNDRGIVFHDPARNPFRVMTHAEFERRWQAAGRWMAVVTPGTAAAEPETAATIPAGAEATDCERTVADGVRAAQANQLDVAERALTAALSCPGAAPLRELAGVRVLQRRWPEAADLASTALAENPEDLYTWRLLATARFVQGDRSGALAAWNRAGEPRVDLVAIDGLARTRHAVVERLLSTENGDVLTPGRLARADRQLRELPSAVTARLDYVPVPGGAVELRGAVAERPLMITGAGPWLAFAARTAATREIAITTGSISGGGEQVAGAWRFWPGRERLLGSVRAPAPWGGVWGVTALAERHTFTSTLPQDDRTVATLTMSDWASGRIRWELVGGLGRWTNEGTSGLVGGGLRVASDGNRVEAAAAANVWGGDASFATGRVSVVARSSTERQGFVWQAAAGLDAVTPETPAASWPAGDTGAVRDSLLRAHPLLDAGRLRSPRLGRILLSSSIEFQHWWRAARVLPVAGAVFTDLAATRSRLDGPSLADADVGIGLRVVMPGAPGLIRIDIAKGLADGATAVSFVYQP